MPHIPTAPSHHGWAASHSTASYAVERLGLGVLVERDAAGRPGARGRRPGTARSRAPRTTSPRAMSRVAPPVVLAVRDHLEDGREALVGSPASGRAARCWPTARCRRGPGSGRPRRLDLVAWRARPGGRSDRWRSSSPSLRARRATPDARRPPRATMRADGRRADPSPAARGPAGRAGVAYENPWITVWHDEVTRPDGSPGIYGVVHFANLAAGRPGLDDDDRVAARRPAPLHARRLLLGDPGGRRARRRDPLDGRAARAARGDRRRAPPTGGSSPGVHLSNSRHRRARRSCSSRPA